VERHQSAIRSKGNAKLKARSGITQRGRCLSL